MGHGWPGRLRQIKTPQLSPDGRLLDLFQRGQSVLVRERNLQVVPRDQAPLSGRAPYSRGHQNRFARGPGDAECTLRAGSVAVEAGTGTEVGQQS